MIFDFHNDAITAGVDVSDCEELFAVTHAIFTSESTRGEVFSNIDKGRRLSRKFKTPLAIEDLGFLNDRDLDELNFSEFLYCSLTWNDENALAGGAFSNGTLKLFGRRVINKLNADGCPIDLSHLNRISFYEVLPLCKTPIVSHTFMCDDCPRGLSRDMMRALIERGALIGLFFVTTYTRAFDVREAARMIADSCEAYGVERFCIGSDFNGSVNMPKDLTNYQDFGKLKNELLSVGFTPEDIDRLLYKNLYDRYKESL